MQNYRMNIAYDGRKYKGFNTIKGDKEKSIQGKLEGILKILYGCEVEVIGAVNTDAGVHASDQIVNFKTPDGSKTEEEIFAYLEKYLTDDIIILSVEKVDDRFHSRYMVKSATYEYRLWKKEAPNRPLFERQYVNLMVQNLDVKKMQEAASALVGEHDFSAFTTNKKIKNPIKNLVSIYVKETSKEIVITMKANGFLLNMERIIVGTLIQVGLGQLPTNTVEKALKSLDAKDVGHKASADALKLVYVDFGEE